LAPTSLIFMTCRFCRVGKTLSRVPPDDMALAAKRAGQMRFFVRFVFVHPPLSHGGSESTEAASPAPQGGICKTHGMAPWHTPHPTASKTLHARATPLTRTTRRLAVGTSRRRPRHSCTHRPIAKSNTETSALIQPYIHIHRTRPANSSSCSRRSPGRAHPTLLPACLTTLERPPRAHATLARSDACTMPLTSSLALSGSELVACPSVCRAPRLLISHVPAGHTPAACEITHAKGWGEQSCGTYAMSTSQMVVSAGCQQSAGLCAGWCVDVVPRPGLCARMC
jgi:hypothetical protein